MEDPNVEKAQENLEWLIKYATRLNEIKLICLDCQGNVLRRVARANGWDSPEFRGLLEKHGMACADNESPSGLDFIATARAAPTRCGIQAGSAQ